MPLPSVTTVRRYIRRVKLECGLDSDLFNALKLKINDMNEYEKQGILIFDEMEFKESIALSVKKMKLT